MFRSVIILGLLACVLAQQISFKEIEDVQEFKLENPDVIEFGKIETKELLKHYLGSRVTGDRLLGEVAGGDQFNTPTNVRYQVDFGPTTGERLTAVVVQVLQSSSKGRAYIDRGGIGQTSAAIFVECYDTTYVDYVVEFYGK